MVTAGTTKLIGGVMTFQLIGDRLAVDFANTALNDSDDGLTGWIELIEFLAATGTISSARRAALADLEASALNETAALFRVAIRLRDAMRQILEARIAGAPLDADWITPINEVLACTEGYDRLEPVHDASRENPEWRITLAARSQGLEWLLAAIARSAAEIVAEGLDAPIRRCANPKCGLFFYDASRTGQRRWCSMSVCGNRSKVAAHFKRKRSRAA
jgi:predicted RNA-binding Zn ribbon-like protein